MIKETVEGILGFLVKDGRSLAGHPVTYGKIRLRVQCPASDTVNHCCANIPYSSTLAGEILLK